MPFEIHTKTFKGVDGKMSTSTLPPKELRLLGWFGIYNFGLCLDFGAFGKWFALSHVECQHPFSLSDAKGNHTVRGGGGGPLFKDVLLRSRIMAWFAKSQVCSII